ncbi:RNA degradosome polyphosphate kinase [Amphibacillus jilinensis]|uniref:RNA degradosome polyphosphate kinase n=1 Tax=Amphibacillus jilinensis TaxID=1216008 RepID=UPI0002FA1E57|nr:RNA degradosome polyphosphate kinase [Amphibacillus jilinensis]
MEFLNHSLNTFNHPTLFNNREISWLRFNKRVLEEAINNSNPLLERLRFLAIFSANLDEFFMVRVAGLKDQVQAGFNRKDNKSGLTPLQQLAAINEEVHPLVNQQQGYYQSIRQELTKYDITICKIEQLSTKQQKWLAKFFDNMIFPVLTPLAIDAYRPFPLLANKSLNIAVVLKSKTNDNQVNTAIVQVPALLDRFIHVIGKHTYVLLEDVIIYFLDKLFNGFQVKSTTIFRITRNADMNIHEEGARDLLKEIEKELKKRRWGAAVRLEIMGEKHDRQLINFLQHVLDIDEPDLYFQNEPLDLSFLFDFYQHLKTDYEALTYQTLIPQPAREFNSAQDIFEQLKAKDIMLHHPYESFEVIVDLIETAAQDPNVLAIKQTLYRVSGDSPILESLKQAAENGKQVTVLVELKARFDEANNVQWAKMLEKAGCHVIYGINGLKTHSKITLIVRRGDHRIERFVHLGTGNYNDQTASLYTDLSILTARRQLAIDATNFFNFLSGYTNKPTFHYLSMSPYSIRQDFLNYIDDEIAHQHQFGNGRIIAKMNALTDKPLIIKFYQASQAGVKIDLIVRGICCLKPGIPGVSENIRVLSIVGRFLEHSRIYYFHNNGDERYLLSSADMMTRNMVKRIELLFPVLDPNHHERLKTALQLFLTDNTNTREQDANGYYHYLSSADQTNKLNSQLKLFDFAYKLMDDEE